MEKSQSFPSKIDRDTENLGLPFLPQEHINSVPKRTCFSRLYLFAVKIALTLLVALTIYTHFFSTPSSPSPYAGALRTIPPVEVQRSLSAFEGPCGNSPAEARQRGCIFDMIAFNWAHHDCWDEDLHNQFLARYPNTWHWETLDGHSVPVEEVLAGAHQFLNTNWDFYIVHCLYVMERAERGSRPLPHVAREAQISDEWSPPFLHVKQCTLDLMDVGKYAGKTIMVTAKMGYPACGTEMK
ncbi:conserved hypothetical protein [Histoplasma capsulatum G186AR]|uniref:Uncharacterized protein n=2 Tax=Ajellomyces capsulatus TaxID=5037 RepID=C0NRW0_AJECG|nr:uncharacterized protein HCBG_05890 [Histoplasma capsulatum G186AR]EEH05626.1 conserved hypothetical protein [Histoplasma capsulatum G186AR]KAG5300220.1 hypothetical protein I7I52_10776 [Histoplasma capsulatum]QSS67149.1 hypothetical protein I7I50_06146 [Histoplasma capsulatum G186AR]